MSNFSIEKIRSEKIRDFYLIHRDGYTLAHRAYVRSKMDDSLLSGFLTAIFAISKELSLDKIQVMDMEDVKFIYENKSPFILILNVNKGVTLEFGKKILSKTMKYFEEFYNGLSEDIKLDLNDVAEELRSIDFNSQVDKFVNNALMDEYNQTPLKIVEAIETYLVSLFGSMGKNIVEGSIVKISKLRSNFKKEYLDQLISLIDEAMRRKINPSQASMITKQLRDTFSKEIIINSAKK